MPKIIETFPPGYYPSHTDTKSTTSATAPKKPTFDFQKALKALYPDLVVIQPPEDTLQQALHDSSNLKNFDDDLTSLVAQLQISSKQHVYISFENLTLSDTSKMSYGTIKPLFNKLEQIIDPHKIVGINLSLPLVNSFCPYFTTFCVNKLLVYPFLTALITPLHDDFTLDNIASLLNLIKNKKQLIYLKSSIQDNLTPQQQQISSAIKQNSKNATMNRLHQPLRPPITFRIGITLNVLFYTGSLLFNLAAFAFAIYLMLLLHTFLLGIALTLFSLLNLGYTLTTFLHHRSEDRHGHKGYLWRDQYVFKIIEYEYIKPSISIGSKSNLLLILGYILALTLCFSGISHLHLGALSALPVISALHVLTGWPIGLILSMTGSLIICAAAFYMVLRYKADYLKSIGEDEVHYLSWGATSSTTYKLAPIREGWVVKSLLSGLLTLSFLLFGVGGLIQLTLLGGSAAQTLAYVGITCFACYHLGTGTLAWDRMPSDNDPLIIANAYYLLSCWMFWPAAFSLLLAACCLGGLTPMLALINVIALCFAALPFLATSLMILVEFTPSQSKRRSWCLFLIKACLSAESLFNQSDKDAFYLFSIVLKNLAVAYLPKSLRPKEEVLLARGPSSARVIRPFFSGFTTEKDLVRMDQDTSQRSIQQLICD